MIKEGLLVVCTLTQNYPELYLLLVVDKGLYTVHSYNAPYEQENGTLNYCWRSRNGEIGLQTFCQVFQAHIPGLYARAKDRSATVSFESVCFPGYYIMQRNYHFHLEKRDGSEHFGENACINHEVFI